MKSGKGQDKSGFGVSKSGKVGILRKYRRKVYFRGKRLILNIVGRLGQSIGISKYRLKFLVSVMIFFQVAIATILN